MAKTTSYPDCVHCRFIDHKHGEFSCSQHRITLHSPVSLFCKMISTKREGDSEYTQWFEERVDIKSLDANTLYTWVETPIEGHACQVEIDAEVIAPISDYRAYSAGRFWETIRNLRRKKRIHYRK